MCPKRCSRRSRHAPKRSWRAQWANEAQQDVARDKTVLPGTDSVTRAYNENRSTQVPAWLAYDVGRSRIVRKIGFGKRVLQYERSRR